MEKLNSWFTNANGKEMLIKSAECKLSFSFHLAAAKGHAECLRIMMTHGVDVTAQDGTGTLL